MLKARLERMSHSGGRSGTMWTVVDKACSRDVWECLQHRLGISVMDRFLNVELVEMEDSVGEAEVQRSPCIPSSPDDLDNTQM